MYDQDVYVVLDQDVLKTSSKDKAKRRLQDVFKMSSSRRMFAGFQHVSLKPKLTQKYFPNHGGIYIIWHLIKFCI